MDYQQKEQLRQLRQEINEELPDEQAASQLYANMAGRAAASGRTDIMEALQRISQQENEHYYTLMGMVNKIDQLLERVEPGQETTLSSADAEILAIIPSRMVEVIVTPSYDQYTHLEHVGQAMTRMQNAYSGSYRYDFPGYHPFEHGAKIQLVTVVAAYALSQDDAEKIGDLVLNLGANPTP